MARSTMHKHGTRYEPTKPAFYLEKKIKIIVYQILTISQSKDLFII